MTSIWGPLGWMTLHSVSTSYPERPSPTERQLVHTWLDLFRDTITCAHCRMHFTTMLQNYRARFPTMLDSRQDFATFAFRAHNAVNARLSKPVRATLADCMETLRKNIETRSPAEYRMAYLNHIIRYWQTMQDMSGITALKKIQEMRKIETTYFALRDTKFDVTLVDQGVVIPTAWVEGGSSETAAPTPSLRFTPGAPIRAGFGFVGGQFRLRK